MRKNQKKLAVLLAVIGVLAFSLLAFQKSYEKSFFPRVTIAGESVSGKSYDEVLASFSKKIKVLQESDLRIVLKAGNRQKNILLPNHSSGLTADNVIDYWKFGEWEEVIKRAYDWGRKGSRIGNIVQKTYSLLFGVDFRMPLTFYKENVIALIQSEVDVFLVKPESASFRATGAGVEILKEKNGERADIGKMAEEARRSLLLLKAGPIVFEAEVDPPKATVAQLSRFLPLVEALSKEGKIILYYDDHKWHINGETIISWLILKPNQDIGVDINKLESFIRKNVSVVINNPPVNSRFQVVNGKMIEIVPGRPGNVVDVKTTAERIESIFPEVQRSFEATGSILAALNDRKHLTISKDETIRIPIEVIEQEPKITKKTIDKYSIRDLIGIAKTNFTGGSAARQHNIEVGVSKLNGLLIAPGEEFSTVRNIGPADEENGFKQEYVIKENRTVKEWGGGLCQVATTLFRTVLDAGLKVTARTNHSFLISYYGPGLDATIYSPSPDFRFVNDTGDYILLQGRAQANEVVFELYGTDDGRKVHISEPVLSNEIPAPPTKYLETEDLPLGRTRCSEVPKNGVTADVTYTVTYKNGRTSQQHFHSVYEPWQKVCLVGTGNPSAVSSF